MRPRFGRLIGLAVFACVRCSADAVPPLSPGPLVGAIRWDAWYGPLPKDARPPLSVPYPGFRAGQDRLVSQDPGSETCRSLAAEPWRYRWPFFTERGADGKARSFNENRTEVLEKEIDYAVHGGLDYWAFTAYPENSPLSYTLKTFLSCKNRDKIRFCLFLPMWPAYGRIPDKEAEQAFWAYAVRMVGQPNYLRVQGNRPVLYVGFINEALAKRMEEGPWAGFTNEISRCGLGKPYLVFNSKAMCDRFGGDALSDYNALDWRRRNAKERTFAELASEAESFWERCEATGTPAVPICMAGFDWRPRVLNPVSWQACGDWYYKSGTPEELAAHIGRGVSWYRKHPGKNGAELVLIYAWNEFDEGGWLVPALPPPDGEGTARLDALRRVLRPKD